MRILRFHTTVKNRYQETQGELTLQIDRADIFGSLTLDGRQSYFQGKMLRKNRYAASLRFKTEVCEEDCDMLLRVRENGSIRGSIIGDWEDWSLKGTAAAAEPFLRAEENALLERNQ
ncbi:hypothetical protein [uncultured Dysosmobacter sp.]|uniref:hypothetical protein n=1 Tax=uncultured Dysosmobacter sp. TaxID=2591384 RepID=UPI00262CF3E1|nr:hypothetical protein [uncultured Dysosmobacter sp.]